MRHCHNNFAARTEDPRPFLESWFNNTCITSEPDGDGGWSDSGIYNFGACDIPALPEGRSSSSTHTASNTFLTPSGDAPFGGATAPSPACELKYSCFCMEQPRTQNRRRRRRRRSTCVLEMEHF